MGLLIALLAQRGDAPWQGDLLVPALAQGVLMLFAGAAALWGDKPEDLVAAGMAAK